MTNIFVQAVIEVIKDMPKLFMWFGRNHRAIVSFVGGVAFIVVPYVVGVEALANAKGHSLLVIAIGIGVGAWLVFSLAVLFEMDELARKRSPD